MLRQENRHIAVEAQSAKNPRHTTIDIFVYGVILSLGALQFGLTLRSSDFFTGDTTYLELARSLLEKGFYGFDFKPETLIPPGFPVILASLCETFGCTYTVFIRSMAVFNTLGFIVTYELLSSMGEQLVGAISCILLDSSPIVFAFTTRSVMSDLPYFFTSMLILLLAVRLDTAKHSRGRTVLWFLCALSIAGSLLIRSSGIALLAGVFVWLSVSWFAKREVSLRRLKTFAPLLLIGLLVEILWMTWAGQHEVLQWPMVGGYPQPYIKQLEMKNGNQPELGKASPTDIPKRVVKNLDDRAVTLMQLLARTDYINPAWVRPLAVLSVLLVVLGLACSIWYDGGGLPEWYFVIHEGMYLLWPWNLEIRFFLPVTPLACLYLWRGGKALPGLVSQLKPRSAGAWSFLLSIMLAMYALRSAWRARTVQPELAATFWTLLSAVFVWGTWTGSYRNFSAFAPFLAWRQKRVSIRGGSLTLAQISGAVVVATLLVVGTAQEIRMGRENLKFDVSTTSTYPDIQAAKWIQANAASTAVVMARQLDVVYHYSGRWVIWFPPVRDPQLLMEGIHNYNVKFIIVNERQSSYWLPPEQDCFESLFRTYPSAFQLVHQEPRLRIYKIIPDLT